MAKVSGGAAYQRLTKPEDGLSQSAQFWGAIDAQKNAAHKLRQEREKVRKQQTKGDLEKKAKEKAKQLEKAHIAPSGYKSHDEPLVKILQGEGGIFDTYSKILDDLESDPNNNDLIIKKVNLEKSIEEIKGLRNGMMARKDILSKGLEDGTLSPSLNKGVIDNYNSLINDFQYDYKINDRGNIVVENKGYDPDGDGIPNELTSQDVWNPENMKLQGRFDVVSWIKGTKELLGKFDITTDNGVTSRRLVGFDPSKTDNLNKEVNVVMGDSLENMTPEAKSYINDTLGLDYREMTDLSFEGVRNDLVNKVKNAYDGVDTTKVDGGTALANKKYNDDKGSTGISFVENIPTESGKPHIKRYAFNSPYIIKGTNKSDRPKTLTEIRYDKHGDRVVLIGKEYHGNESTRTSESSDDESQKTSTTQKADEWKDVIIKDKAEVTSILSKVLDVNTYESIVDQLKGTEDTEEDKSKIKFN